MKKLLVALAVSAAAIATPALAVDYSFTGTFAQDNSKAQFNFAVGSASTVTLVTYSYAGGTNAAGMTIARGGFDPILSLYDTVSGNLIAYNDDGGSNVPPDTNGIRFDTYLQSMLAPGAYTVFVTQYANFGPNNYLTGTFPQDGNPNFRNGFIDVSGSQRDGHWAFDVLGADAAVQAGVPEPATWAMMIVGFGLAGAGMRRRSAVRVGKVSFA